MSGEKYDQHKIRKVTVYEDGEGRMVREYIQVFGKDKNPNALDGIATFNVRAQNPMTGQVMTQTMKLEFEFPLGTGVKKAFELFDEYANRRMEEYKKQQEDKAAAARIVGAKNIPLMGPDGKPMKGKRG